MGLSFGNPNYLLYLCTQQKPITMIEKIVTIVNFLNTNKVTYNLVDEDDQIRIELSLNNSHDTNGDYIVITKDGIVCMNLFTDLPLKNVYAYIIAYNE
jgi:hypothetical protein